MKQSLVTNPDWNLARRYYRAERFSQAGQAIDRYLSLEPECGRGWELLGLIEYSQNHCFQALQALEEASVRVPLGSRAQCALADCYLVKGRAVWARQLYEQLLNQSDVPVRILLKVAAGLNQAANPQLAVAACRRAIQIDPSSAESYFNLACYLASCGASCSTIEASAHRAVSLAPDNLTFRVGLAGFLQARQRSREATLLLENLTFEHVQSMRCRACLERLTGIFEAIDDRIRSAWCYRQREALALKEQEDSCGEAQS